MLFSSPIRQRDLADLCYRLAVAMESGIDARKVFAREATGRSPAAVRRTMAEISQAIAQGTSLPDALAATGNFFPPFFRAMVDVGEQTGHSAEVFRHLAEHYANQEQLRRMFLQGIAGPLMQLAAAIGIIGLVIYLMGFMQIDMLGFGLRGMPGLLRYIGGLLLIALVLGLLWGAWRRGLFWVRPLEYALLRVPALGSALETLALARLSKSLQLTYGVGMELQRALDLSIRSMQNRYYVDRTEDVVRSLRQGQEISEALAATHVFPAEFLDALEVGERSGRVPETMGVLAAQYRDRSERALATLTQFAGMLVWAAVASVIIFVIWRVFSFYLNTLNQAMNGR